MGVGGELKPLSSRGSTKKRRMKGGQADSTKASHVRHLLCDLIETLGLRLLPVCDRECVCRIDNYASGNRFQPQVIIRPKPQTDDFVLLSKEKINNKDGRQVSGWMMLTELSNKRFQLGQIFVFEFIFVEKKTSLIIYVKHPGTEVYFSRNYRNKD